MYRNQHIIQRLVFDVDSGFVNDHFSWQNEVADFCKIEGVPLIEASLDQIISPEQRIQIGKLEIELGVVDKQSWKADFSKKLLEQLQKQLEKYSNNNTKANVENKAEEVFYFFLKSGALPWWGVREDLDLFFQSPVISFNKLYPIIKDSPHTLERLLHQCLENVHWQVLESYVNTHPHKQEGLFQTVQICLNAIEKTYSTHESAKRKEKLWRLVLKGVFYSSTSNDKLAEKIILNFLPEFFKANKQEIYKSLDNRITISKNKILRFINTNAIAKDLSSLVRPSDQFWVLISPIIDLSFIDFNTSYSHYISLLNHSKQLSVSIRKIYESWIAHMSSKQGSNREAYQERRSRQDDISFERSTDEIPIGLNDEFRDNTKQDVKKEEGFGSEDLEDAPTSKHGNIETNLNTSKNTEISQAHEKGTKHISDFGTPGLNKKNTDAVNTAINLKEEDLYVSYAGCVILHPFLPAFFQSLGLLRDKEQFISQQAQNRAAHLIQYLASGNTLHPEYDLIVAKLLTGLPLPQTLDKEIILNEKEIEESQTLLAAVIRHWKVLKNSSIEALQEGFFKRDGKLCLNEEQYVLWIERKTIDILLEKLPWTISLTKLPWMEKTLNIRWI